MSFTVADLPDFLELLRQHPEWRDSVRYELAGDWLRAAESVERIADEWDAQVKARFDRVEARLDAAIDEMRRSNALSEARFASLKERFANTDDQLAAIQERFLAIDRRFDAIERRFESIAKRFDAADRRFDELDTRLASMDAHSVQRFEALDVRLAAIDAHSDERFAKHDGRFGNLDGGQYEQGYHAVAHLADYFRRLAVISIGDVEELLDARDSGAVTAQEFRKLKALDFLLRGRDGKGGDAPVVYVALEVSLTVASSDIRRAAERAAILRKAGLDARAFAGGRTMPAQLRPLAAELAVTLLIDQDEAAA